MKTKKTPTRTLITRCQQTARVLGLNELERRVRDAAADPERVRWLEWWWYGLVSWNELAAALEAK